MVVVVIVVEDRVPFTHGLDVVQAQAADMETSKNELETEVRTLRQQNQSLSTDKRALKQNVEKLTMEVNEWHELAEQRLHSKEALEQKLLAAEKQQQQQQQQVENNESGSSSVASLHTQTDVVAAQAEVYEKENRDLLQYKEEISRLIKSNENLSWQVSMFCYVLLCCVASLCVALC